MICLTGDIHHDSLCINDQKYIPKGLTEIRIADMYLDILQSYNVKATLYTTGLTLVEQWKDFKRTAESPLIEIGGHTFSGLPRPFFSKLKSAFGITTVSHADTHGKKKAQARDIKKMIDIVHKCMGKKLLSWRSHGLVRDEHTYGILAENGVRFISDEINWNKLLPEKLPSGLISHPLNVIMDHDHLYHAHRTPEYVVQQQLNWPLKEDPTSESYSIEEWGELVEKQVSDIEAKGGVATVLMHPLCHYLADKFKTAERLIKIFSRYKNIFAYETGGYIKSDK